MTGESHVEALKAGITGPAGFENPATEILFMAGYEIRDVTTIRGEANSFATLRGGAGTDYGDRAPPANLYGGDSVANSAPGGHAKVVGGRGDIGEKGGNAYLTGGKGTGSGAGGNSYVQGGFHPLGDGGNVYIQGGYPSASDGLGGKITIETLDSHGDHAGPDIDIITGEGNRTTTASYTGGNLNVTLGAGAGGGAGGTLNVTAGLGRGSGAQEGKGGNINLTAGASNLREGGDIDITAGQALTDAAGGKIFLNGGDGVDGGGSLSLTGGASTGAGNFTGAQVGLFAGAGGGTFSGQGGDVRLQPGNRATTANADPGGVNIQGMMIRENSTLGTLSSNTTLELDLGFLFIATIQGAASVEFDFGRVRGNVSITCELELTNGGAGTVTWDAAIKWPGGVAPTLTVAGIDWLRFSTNDDGASWYGEVIGLDMS